MRMASSTVFGVVLAVAMFSAGVTLERLTNVYITNFPLDSQGNLRIAMTENPTSVTINVTISQLITVVLGQLTLLGEANVNGWKFAGIYIYWSDAPPPPSYLALDYIMCFRTSMTPQMRVIDSGGSFQPFGQAVYIGFSVQGPILDIWVRGYSGVSGATFQSNVTVSIYLTR